MRFFVRSVAVAALALGGLACSDSPTQTSDSASHLQGRWIFDPPQTNNPGGHYSFSLDLAVQGTTVSGSATKSWIGPTTYAVTGTLKDGRVTLDGAGVYAGVTPVAFHFQGVLMGSFLLIGNLTEMSDGMSYPAAMTFRKSP
jgi:hypothetical protein